MESGNCIKKFGFYAIPLILIQFSGCVSFPKYNDYLACDFSSTLVKPPTNNDDSGKAGNQILSAPICTGDNYSNFKNSDALVISGGAADGAFGAGFISELVMQNKMAVKDNDALPNPCVITGVSTGALMSPFVYLATSLDPEIKSKDYALALQKLYPKLDDYNLLSPKNKLLQVLRLKDKKSLYSAQAIKQEIELQLTNQLIMDVQKEHLRTGRKIYIGTTNINTGNFEIIDLTRLFEKANPQPTIIDEHNKQCAFAVIRGSTSIPVVFEPVAVKDKEEFKLLVDGGIRYPLFLHKQIINRLKSVGESREKNYKNIRVFTVINHLDQQLKKDPDSNPAKGEVSLNEYLGNFAEITRNQLYLDSVNTLKQLSDQEGLQAFWVDATDAESQKCAAEKPFGKQFHKNYQECLVGAGAGSANKALPWGFVPKLRSELLNN